MQGCRKAGPVLQTNLNSFTNNGETATECERRVGRMEGKKDRREEERMEGKFPSFPEFHRLSVNVVINVM